MTKYILHKKINRN